LTIGIDIKNEKFLEKKIEEPVSFLNQTFNINNSKIIIKSDFGVSLYPIDASTSDSLIKCAKLALLKIRIEAGKHYQFYDVSLEKNVHFNPVGNRFTSGTREKRV